MHGHGPRVAGSFSAARLLGRKMCGRVFAGPELVAGEEARPGAGGQHAQMPPRADAPLARPRPAPGGRCKQSIGSACMHKNPAGPRIVHFLLRCTVIASASAGFGPVCWWATILPIWVNRSGPLFNDIPGLAPLQLRLRTRRTDDFAKTRPHSLIYSPQCGP
jgi:hypothetical protein